MRIEAARQQIADLPINAAMLVGMRQTARLCATIHPFFDGNGRTARLLTTLILHLGGYGLKGLCALEEYYARDLECYYNALTTGPSHNYYFGRTEADLTGWLDYFLHGMAASFEAVTRRARDAQWWGDDSATLYRLDPRQRKVLTLFANQDRIRSTDISDLFGIRSRTASAWCAAWVRDGFLIVVDPSRKRRSYAPAPAFRLPPRTHD